MQSISKGKAFLMFNIKHHIVWKSVYSVIEIFKSGIRGDRADLATLIWRSGASGEYSVKKGYRIAYRWKLAKNCSQGEPRITFKLRSIGRHSGGLICQIE